MSTTTAAVAQNPSIEEFLGERVQKNVKGSVVLTNKALKNVKLIGLYFSASWCPPCKQFSPILKQFYHTVNDITEEKEDDEDENNKNKKPRNLEIIYVSSDRTIPSFEEYYATLQPFLTISVKSKDCIAIKQKLAQQFLITGLPSLIILDGKNLNYITNDAKNAIMKIAYKNDESEAKKLLEEWTHTRSVPHHEVKNDMANAAMAENGFFAMFKTLLKNPMVLIGIWFYAKKFYTKWEESKGGGTLEADGSGVDDTLFEDTAVSEF